MKKTLLTIFATSLISAGALAQHTWFDLNASPMAVNHIAFSESGAGTFTASVANPDVADTGNTNVAKWSFTSGTAITTKQELDFTFEDVSDITAAEINGMTLTIRLYVNSATALADIDRKRYVAENSRIRFYLGNKFDGINFDPADEGKWVEYTTNITDADASVSGGNITLVETDVDDGSDPSNLLTEDLNIYIDTYISNNVDVSGVLDTNEVTAANDNLRIVSNLVSENLLFTSEVEAASIYNSTGQVVKSLGRGTLFDVSELGTGIYIVKAQINNSYKTIKFIKK